MTFQGNYQHSKKLIDRLQTKRCKPALLSVFHKSEILDNSMKAHREILEAFRQKDVKKLEHIIQEHWNPPLL
jgi:DNA-binding GntR family transcriptional regulator